MVDDKKKKEIFERWMKNVQHLEPEFYVRELVHMGEKVPKVWAQRISKMDSLTRRIYASMFIRGRRIDRDNFIDNVTFIRKSQNVFRGDTFLLEDIGASSLEKMISAFTVFSRLLDFSKKKNVDIFCERYDGEHVDRKLFISPQTSFEEMQVEADLKEIEES